MNKEEVKQLMHDLNTSPDFLSSLEYCVEQMRNQDEPDIRAIGLFFYSQGYMSCLEYTEKKDRYRSYFSYKESLMNEFTQEELEYLLEVVDHCITEYHDQNPANSVRDKLEMMLERCNQDA